MDKVKRVIGWCPQKKIVYRTEDEFISDYAYSIKTHANDNPIHECMDVPLQMFDWRVWAIILSFAGLIIFSTAWYLLAKRRQDKEYHDLNTQLYIQHEDKNRRKRWSELMSTSYFSIITDETTASGIQAAIEHYKGEN